MRRGERYTDKHRRKPTGRHGESEDTREPGREGSQEANSANPLTLDLRFPELRENKFLLFKPPSVWCLVMAALANSTLNCRELPSKPEKNASYSPVSSIFLCNHSIYWDMFNSFVKINFYTLICRDKSFCRTIYKQIIRIPCWNLKAMLLFMTVCKSIHISTDDSISFLLMVD